ncbi:MAG: S8 family peptidase [Rhodoferax sp.]
MMKRLLALLLCGLIGAGAAMVASASGVQLQSKADSRQQVMVMLNLPAQHFRPGGNDAGSYGDAAGRVARRRVAGQLAREHGLTMVADWPMPVLGVDCYAMRVPAHKSPEQVAQTLSHDARVVWAQPMNVYQAHQDPDYTLYMLQPAARQWQLAALHEVATGRGVRVAVIDSAVQIDHPDLARSVELSENFVAGRPNVAEAHGTGVAGVIAARAANAVGIVGIAPQARLMALRACWQQSNDATLCTSLSLAEALDFAIQHDAQVINLSLSGPPDRLLARLLDAALARGITVVAAVDGTAQGGFPASHQGVVAVGDAMNPAAPGAVVAPGRDIPTTAPGSRWTVVSGTSYAAAHVSGLFALLRQTHPLPSTSAEHSAKAELVLLPGGRIDACATLMRAANRCTCACAGGPAGPQFARH